MGSTMTVVGHWQVLATLPPTMDLTVGELGSEGARFSQDKPSATSPNDKRVTILGFKVRSL
jgi:hypothetical protein